MSNFNRMPVFESADRLRLGEHQEKLYDALIVRKKGNSRVVQERIDPSDFYSETGEKIYTKEDIENDARYVKDMEEAFARDAARDPEIGRGEKSGNLFEAAIFEGIESGCCMGDEVRIKKSSRYDDIRNGVDGIITFPEEKIDSHLAFGVDVTQSVESVSRKFAKIKESIDNEKLSEIKYFKDLKYRGKLLKVPRVVVGIDGNGMEEMARIIFAPIQKKDYLNSLKQNKYRTKEEQRVIDSNVKEYVRMRNEFANSIFQMVILKQMSAQLHAFAEYAKKKGKKSIALIYEEAAAKIDEIYFAKKNERDDEGRGVIDILKVREYIEQDKVCMTIKQQIAGFGISTH